MEQLLDRRDCGGVRAVVDLVIAPRDDTEAAIVECAKEWAVVGRLGQAAVAWSRYQIARLVDMADRRYGAQVVSSIADAIGVTPKSVYHWLPLATLTEVEARRILLERGTLQALLSAVSEKQISVGGLRETVPVEAVEREREAIEQSAIALERRTEAFRSMVQRHVEVLPQGEIEESDGVIMAAEETVAEVRVAVEEPNPGPYRSEGFKAFVRALGCCVCGRPGVDAHHVEVGGMGTKGTDLSCIPLCRTCHQEAESKGARQWEAWEVDPVRVQLVVMGRYIQYLEEQGIQGLLQMCGRELKQIEAV